MKIAVIPARGGSKRIPRKNIKFFCGKPMIAWSIEAALGSGCFDHVIVSTDDVEIADIARDFGAEVPFLRPSNISDDFSTTLDVMKHAVEWLIEKGFNPDAVCCIYATAPFILPKDLNQSFLLLTDTVDYVFSVTSFPYPIQRALKITDNGRIEMFAPDNFYARSQDLEKAYHDAGQFYWGRVNSWLGMDKIFSSVSKPWVLNRYQVQDIDDLEDWERAEWLFRAVHLGGFKYEK